MRITIVKLPNLLIRSTSWLNISVQLVEEKQLRPSGAGGKRGNDWAESRSDSAGIQVPREQSVDSLLFAALSLDPRTPSRHSLKHVG